MRVAEARRRGSSDGASAWRRPGCAAFAPAPASELLEALFASCPPRTLRRLPGRETFLLPGREDLVVKRTKGGEPRDYWYERLRGTPRSPARREAENLLALEADGVPVPEALLWVQEPAASRHPRRAGRSALVMRRESFEETLRERLTRADAEERSRWSGVLLRLVRRLHAAGWIHRDLYTQHLVVRGAELVLLDVGRARRVRSGGRHAARWYVKDLAALAASLPCEVGRAERLRFLRAWLEEHGVRGRAARRCWVRRIQRKARRILGHRPRRLDPGDPVDARLLAGECLEGE